MAEFSRGDTQKIAECFTYLLTESTEYTEGHKGTLSASVVKTLRLSVFAVK